MSDKPTSKSEVLLAVIKYAQEIPADEVHGFLEDWMVGEVWAVREVEKSNGWERGSSMNPKLK